MRANNINTKPATKRSTKAAAKASVAVTPAAPVTVDTPAVVVAKPAKPVAPDTRAARQAATIAVSAYYGGASLPFKSAHDKFADLRLDKAAKQPTARQAALLATMLAADIGGNIKPDGTFQRGGFNLPASLFDANAPAGAIVLCQPETGCLSDMLGRAITYVSGPTAGKAQAATILRLDFDVATTELALLGGALAKAALARISELRA